MAAGAENGEQNGLTILPLRTKLVYALGDHTMNMALFALLSVFPAFLTEVAGMRPALAGLIPLIGRIVDAVTDPAMGRLSDGTTWKGGRRRPFLLIGMVPFGLAFGALWWAVPASEGHWQFAYYAATYVLFSLASTVLAVPYMALIPEMTSSYDERTSMNAARAVGAILGALLAATLPLVAASLGGGGAGYQRMGIAAGLYVMLPWIFVHAVTFERRAAVESPKTAFLASVLSIARRKSFQILAGLYLLGRIAIDLTSSMFILFFTYRMQRPEDFTPTLMIFMIMVAVALPIWAAVARRTEKRTIFLFGAGWWIGSQTFLFVAQPDWPSWVVFLGAGIGGVGYAAADMIPWSMLGEVIDEDELESSERREGIYFGLFTFMRKLGGALGIAVAFAVLDWAGYRGGQPVEEAPVGWIRVFTAVIPGIFVFLAAIVALAYPLGRARHTEILQELDRRKASTANGV
ncbi:MAG: MFS transporter [Deltaproteobacteria bacterium]|nr:MFS transporter [Deltaproteobacteria bacterium]MBW2397260.1 MFS transporter [Deltaproteobacteria bacterium]